MSEQHKQPIFSYHARIHIRSELSGSAMLVNMNAHASTKTDLLKGIEKESLKYVKEIKDFKEKDYREIIKSKKEEKWSNKRIRNHFAKFGIELLPIDLPEEKTRKKNNLPEGQKTLC